YRRAKQEISVSLPERRYELIGRIFADAIRDNATTGQHIETAVARAATAAARRIGDEVRADAGGEAVSLAAILASCGYEPRTEGDQIILANCPFGILAQHDRELVCGMDLEFVTAMTRALDLDDIEMALDPGEDRCCVTLRQLAR